MKRLSIIVSLIMLILACGCDLNGSGDGKLYPVYLDGMVAFCDENGDIRLHTSYDECQLIFTETPYTSGAEAAQALGFYSGSYANGDVYYYLKRTPRRSDDKRNGAEYAMAILDSSGRVIFENEGINITWFVSQNGMLELWNELTGLSGLLNLNTGEMAVEMEYDQLWQIYDGIAKASKTVITESGTKTQESFIDMQSKTVLNVNNYAWCLPYISDGLVAVYKDNKWGYIDKTGYVVIPFVFDEAGYFVKGVAPVKVADGWTLIDKKGNVLLKERYDRIESFTCGTAIAYDGKNFGVIDTTGKTVIGFNYSSLMLTAKTINGKREYFYVGNRNGDDEETFFVFSATGEVLGKSRGYCYIFTNMQFSATDEKSGLVGVADANGGWHIEPKYTSIYQDGEYVIAVCGEYDSVDNLIDIYNLKNKRISEMSFKHVTVHDKNMIYVETDEYTGYINAKGEWVIKIPVYTTLSAGD